MGRGPVNTTRAMDALPGAAAAAAVLALACFGALSPDHSHALHPVALLGARGEPNAAAFNLLGFVLPGLLLAWHAHRMRGRLRAPTWRARIGLQLAMFSALAFAAQGLLPLDPYDLAAPDSRLHALAWTLWWVAFVPGALLAGVPPRSFAQASAAAIALAVPLFALAGPEAIAAGVAQRIAFALWLAWWCVPAPPLRARR